MADIFLNSGGKNYKRVVYDQIAGATILAVHFSAATSAEAEFTAASPTSSPIAGDMDQLHLKANVANSFTISGARFTAGGNDYVVKSTGELQVNPSPASGNGAAVGTLVAAQAELTLTAWPTGMAPLVTNWRAAGGAPVNGADTPFATYGVTFRTNTAPLRPSSLSILGTMQDGTVFNVSADSDGIINTSRIKGRVNYNTGVVQIIGVTPSAPAGQSVSDLTFLGISGVTSGYIDLIRAETVRYNAVAYTYLPLDPELLGIDPVRLPTDGRVPIFRPAGFFVIGNTQTTTPATAVNAGVVNCGRTRLSRVRVIGNNGATIETGFTVDLEAGTVTWTNVTGYSQPVRVEHRIEDMSQIRDAQINGEITGLRALTHNFPTSGSYVSSALMAGDVRARTSLTFDQASWGAGNLFSDSIVGDPATATYNDTGYPITVTNRGAITERWVLKFTTTMNFQIIGEHLGVIGTGSINTPTEPINPDTGEPYFTIPVSGWGSGWSIGNIVRINTVGATVPFWLARTIKQGPEAGEDYSFTTLVRGNIDNPI